MREHAAVGKPRDGGDPVTLKRNHHQPIRARDRGLRVREVTAESGLTIGPRGHEPEGP